MDKMRIDRPCSPYLRRPLRTLDQALKDQAGVIPHEDEPIRDAHAPAEPVTFRYEAEKN